MNLKLRINGHKSPDDPRNWIEYEGRDAKSLLDQWNDSPDYGAFPPAEFRQLIVNNSGAEIHGGMPAADEEILPAVVAAYGPEEARLEARPR